MTLTTQPVIIIPSHLASCIRTAIPSTGLLLGSFHEDSFIIKQLVTVPWNETLSLKTFYSDAELMVLGWFVQSTENKLMIKARNWQMHFKETDLRMGIVRSYNEFHGYCLINDVVEECEVRIMERSGLSTFLQECYNIEPFIDDIQPTQQRDNIMERDDTTLTLINDDLFESYKRSCIHYEVTVGLYHLLMLPDDVLIKRLLLMDAFEERKKRLESCFKDATLSPEQLIQCLASVNINTKKQPC